MTYDSLETSAEGSRPVEIFKVTAGATLYHYTSAQDDQIVGPTTYTAVAGLERTATVEGPEKRENDFQIQLPTENALAQIFVGVMPGIRVRLQVSRFQRDDTPTPEVVQIFDGYILSASFKDQGKLAVLTARPEIASRGKQIPNRTYQSTCNLVLYQCGVDDTDPAFRASALNVASQVGDVLTVSSGLSGTYADGWMQGGFVQDIAASDYRLILEHTGNTLTLLTPFSTTPSTVNVFAGCAHTIDVCKSKFDNVVNFGGHAFVPKKNIFETGIS